MRGPTYKTFPYLFFIFHSQRIFDLTQNLISLNKRYIIIIVVVFQKMLIHIEAFDSFWTHPLWRRMISERTHFAHGPSMTSPAVKNCAIYYSINSHRVCVSSPSRSYNIQNILFYLYLFRVSIFLNRTKAWRRQRRMTSKCWMWLKRRCTLIRSIKISCSTKCTNCSNATNAATPHRRLPSA